MAALAHETLIRGLEKRGFALRDFENVLAREISPNEDFRSLHPHGYPEGVVIERVDPTNDAQAELHVRTSLSGFVDGEPAPALLQTGLNAVRHPRSRSFNARIGDRVVAAGAMAVNGELCPLFGVSVIPEARRRGIQLAMILERLHLGASEGARFAVIHSEPGIPTDRNASRIGFRLVYTKVTMAMAGEGLERSM